MATLSTLRFIAIFLFSHSKSSDPKYTGLLHPLTCLFFTSSLYLIGMNKIDSELRSDQIQFNISPQQRYMFGFAILGYLLLMIFVRFREMKSIVFYEMMWACNLSLLSSAWALFANKPRLLETSMILVSIDQVLWYVDLAAFALFRVFPVGVAKYLTWPTTTKLRMMTSFHHIFYLPLGIYLLKGIPTISYDSYRMNVAMTLLLSILSRFLAPKSIMRGTEEVYLNLNISHELWRDVPFRILKIVDGKPFFLTIPFCSLMWNSGNYILGYKLLNMLK